MDDATTAATIAGLRRGGAEPSSTVDARVRASSLCWLLLQQEAARRAVDTPGNGHSATAPLAAQPGELSDDALHEIAAVLVPFVKELVRDALDARPYLTDGGTWNSTKAFKANELVTYAGAPWICQQANSGARPGSSNHWRLIGKTKGSR